ncbi:MAG TPA: DUF2330 domain-containing protein [Acidimicrobiia bacterium]|nr:DUF2330 domain-containing protein [Acidimicrobiia bacterium]
MRRIALLLVLVGASVLLAAGPAAACGGLVGENGTIQLTRTTTLAAYHDGVERYVTSFEFSGRGQEVGSIVPLPGVPTKVERGGDWTLQRLEREVNPVPETRVFDAAASAANDEAQVLYSTKIDALDITILRGGANAVGKWALDHGFLLTPDAPQVLDFYSRRSKIFMAARFDANRARELGQNSGDGTPIMLTIPVAEPWVPLRILALGLDRTKIVDADVFLLTDHRPLLRAGDTGLTLARSDEASSSLLGDLRSDKGMQWVPDDMWLSYLRVNTPAGNLNYDLAVSTHDGVVPSARLVGIGFPGGLRGPTGSSSAWWDVLGVTGGILVAVTAIALARRFATRTATP